MRRTEEPNYTPEQVRDCIARALELVAALEPPDDLREAAFAKAAELFSTKQVFFEQVQPLMQIPRQRLDG